MSNPENVVNPGTVNVADQGDGLLTVDQTVTHGPGTNPGPVIPGVATAPDIGPVYPNQPVIKNPSSNSGPLIQAGDEAPGVGTGSPNQTIVVTPPMTAQKNVEGGTFSPTSPNTQNTTANTVINQVYGSGTPKNVYV